MKKLILSLSAILMAFMMTSCGDPTSRVKSLTEDIEKNGNDWTDEAQWDDAMVTIAEAIIDFANSDPDEDAYEDFKDAVKDCYTAVDDIDDKKAKKARDKASDKFDKNHKDLKKEMEKAEKKLRKISRKFEDD